MSARVLMTDLGLLNRSDGAASAQAVMLDSPISGGPEERGKCRVSLPNRVAAECG